MNQKLSFFFIVCTLIGIPFCTARLREYEESCNIYKPTENCRPDLDLVCHDNVCACKENAFYDNERKACVVKIGEICPKEQISNRNFVGSHHTISRCPLNAVCEQKNPNKTPDIPNILKGYDASFGGMSQQTLATKCHCKRGFYPAKDNRNCIAALEHNETCSEEIGNTGKICDFNAGLVCANSGRCLCNPTENTHYDENTRRCLMTVNEECSSNTFCEKNSICSTILDQYKRRYGAIFNRMGNPASPPRNEGMGKRTGKCVCLPGFTLNTEGKCAGSFSVSCSAENPCNADKFLSCIDGICQCQAGSHQAFSAKENSTCVLLAGSACNGQSGPKCVANSTCSENGHCQCETGFSESPTGKCLLSHEKECAMPDNSLMQQAQYVLSYRPQQPQPKPEFKESCNFYQGLSCRENKCECFDSLLKWDSKKRMCIAGLDERCGSVAMMRTNEFDYQNEIFYPTASLMRRYYPGNLPYVSGYFVACAEGLTCTKDHNEINGWRVCEKKL